MEILIGDILLFYPYKIYLTLLTEQEDRLLLEDICGWKFAFIKEGSLLCPLDYLHDLDEAKKMGLCHEAHYRLCRL
jgi:hypothetical protein